MNILGINPNSSAVYLIWRFQQLDETLIVLARTFHTPSATNAINSTFTDVFAKNIRLHSVNAALSYFLQKYRNL